MMMYIYNYMYIDMYTHVGHFVYIWMLSCVKMFSAAESASNTLQISSDLICLDNEYVVGRIH